MFHEGNKYHRKEGNFFASQVAVGISNRDSTRGCAKKTKPESVRLVETSLSKTKPFAVDRESFEKYIKSKAISEKLLYMYIMGMKQIQLMTPFTRT